MSTMSLRSSIYEFVEENGRTYHSYKQGSKWSFLVHPGPFSQIRTVGLTLLSPLQNTRCQTTG